MFRFVPQKLPQRPLPYQARAFVRTLPGPLAKPQPTTKHHTPHLGLRKRPDLRLCKTFQCAKANVEATDCARANPRFPPPNPASREWRPSSSPCRPENARQRPRESAAAMANQIRTNRDGSELNAPPAQPVEPENSKSREFFRGPWQRQ